MYKILQGETVDHIYSAQESIKCEFGSGISVPKTVPHVSLSTFNTYYRINEISNSTVNRSAGQARIDTADQMQTLYFSEQLASLRKANISKYPSAPFFESHRRTVRVLLNSPELDQERDMVLGVFLSNLQIDKEFLIIKPPLHITICYLDEITEPVIGDVLEYMNCNLDIEEFSPVNLSAITLSLGIGRTTQQVKNEV